ncbi:MAG: response regulator [Longimicrobiales bacterium]
MKHRLHVTPLVLLVDNQEETSRSLASVLEPRGHVVLRAFTGQQAVDLAGKVSPDAVLVKMTLPDFDGIELVRVLGRAPTIHATTPILMVSDDSVGKAERLEALGSGAWDVLAEPIDPNELILRLDTFIRAKQEADRVRDDGLTDPATGFYNVRGILQRVKEITADAGRHDRALTCVAFGSRPSADGTMTPSPELERIMSEPVAAALREATRLSDTIGRLGPGEFVVIAPGTDQEGAIRLADRVLEALDSDPEREGYGVSAESLAQVRAGFCALEANDQTTPEDLLLRATMALRKSQADEGSFGVRVHEA